MSREIKIISLIVITCIALGIAVVVSIVLMGNAFSSEPIAETAATEEEIVLRLETEAADEFIMVQTTEAAVTAPETTVVPEETVGTTLPETLPTETTLPETVPPETMPPETMPPETEPVKTTIDTVPQYFQTDYPDKRYGTGTIADSGCNMTALAMVASYLTDHAYYPDELADGLAHFIGNNYERLEYGSNLLQLSWEKAGNFHDAVRALKEGKVVIAVMNHKSLFTTGQHFIVLTGITEDGLIWVNDPNANNYEAWNLKDGFQNGFREGLILCGFGGAWIYDKAAMPDDPFIYTPEPYAEEPRYPGMELTEEEMDMMAELIWMEAQSEPFEGQQAIAEVILNRLASGNFQSSVSSIIHAEGQFASAGQLYKAEPTYSQYKAIERALYGPYVLPKEVVFYAKFAVNDDVWGTIGDHTFCYAY